MGSLKALQEWCRIQCENHNDVDIKNMSSSFRDGLAFCAIIHRYRPDLIDFDSLSKENVYENNRLAFEVAEVELGIPALLDPEDMVSMKVPDRLSVITYVSQYYNYFTNKSHANPPSSMKRPSGTGHIEPAQKRSVAPLEDRVGDPEQRPPSQQGELEAGVVELKRSALSSSCVACRRHVHLVQRFLVDGKLYHRNCFRCRECSSTLLPGSYKAGSEAGSLVCTHHYARPALANQNGRPDISKKPTGIPSARIGRPTPPLTPPSAKDQIPLTPPSAQGQIPMTPPSGQGQIPLTPPSVQGQIPLTPPCAQDQIPLTPPSAQGQIPLTPPSARNQIPLTPPSEEEQTRTPTREGVANETPTNDSNVHSPPSASETNSSEKQSENGGETEVSTAPPNPFDDSDEEDEEAAGAEKEEDKEDKCRTPAKDATNGDHLPPTPVSRPGGGVGGRPVPAPRRVCDIAPPPRPVRPPRVTDSPAANGEEGGRSVPTARPRDRSHSPGSSSLSNDTLKPKDPPWLALVQSETKKKPAPPPPPGGVTPPRAGSLSSLKGAGSRPATPPPPANPFDDDEDEEAGQETEAEAAAGAVAPAVVASHPWYSITQPGEGGADTPPSGGSSSRSASPGGSKIRKGPAPRPPQPPSANAALPHSQPSSSSPSPAISVESLSSASDHSSSHPPLRGVARDGEDHPFTKSVSEPSICGPCDSASSLASSSASSAERLPRLSQGSSPPAAPANTSSAPSTPQTNRSTRPPPPRPPATASPLAATGGAASLAPPSRNKRPCKENPFNRKASPSPTPPKSRPPRGPRPARPPAPGHGFPLIKRKVQSDQYIPVEDIHGEMSGLERQLDELEQRGVELEKKLRDNPNDEEEEHLLVDWFTLIHEKHLLVRREAELVYTAKQQNLEERQADVEYELRCLLNKPEKDWSEEDKAREQELMAELVTIIEQRNQIINNMDQDRQRDEEEDKLLEAMLKKKDFQKEPEGDQKKKKSGKFKPMKVLKRLSHKGEAGKGPEKS